MAPAPGLDGIEDPTKAASGEPGAGNTLGCRINQVLEVGSNAAQRCANAGPTGGDLTGTGSSGACGEPCDVYCALMASPTVGNLPILSCSGQLCPLLAAQVAPYSTADAARNDVGCRFTYLTQAAVGGAAATTNCPKAANASTACTQ